MNWFNLLNILGSVVLVTFGLFVWRVEPRNPQNRAFGLFAVGFSLSTALANVELLWSLEGATLTSSVIVRGVLYGLGGLGAAWLALATVRPARREAVWASVPGGLLLAILVFLDLTPGPLVGTGPVSGRIVDVGFLALLGGMIFGVLLLGFAFSRADTLAERRELGYLSAALVLYGAFFMGRLAAVFVEQALAPSLESPVLAVVISLVTFGTLLAILGVWMRNARSRGGFTPARSVMILTVAMGLLGMAVAVANPTQGSLGVPFLARTGAVAILGYAILRGQILGLDAKVEWGLSRTTVAGIFVAVFFVAGELAETFFGDVFGPYFGVIAAGMLVFAISPLQRVADRFAAKAVPGGAEAGAGVEASYRRAVRVAQSDGEITRDEEHELADLADELGLSAGRALEIREQVEEESEGGDPR